MIAAIAAVDEDYGLGKDGSMPWPRNKKDLAWFKYVTSGHVVVMGSKTWASLPKAPLTDRINVVISTKEIEDPRPHWIMEGDVGDDLQRLHSMYPKKNIFVIGGASIYRQAFHCCDQLFLTRIPGLFDCDTSLEFEQVIAEFPYLAATFDPEPDGTKFEVWCKEHPNV